MDTRTAENTIAAWSRCEVETSRDPGLPAQLYAELARAAETTPPVSPEPCAGGLLATVVARDEEVTLGWATLHEAGGEAAAVCWVLAVREIDRLANGFLVFHGLSDAELALLASLIDAAATLARDLDRTALLWSTSDDAVDRQLATAMGADEHRELARHWMIPHVPGWVAPPDVPTADIRVGTRLDPAHLPDYADLHSAATGSPRGTEEVRWHLVGLDADLRLDLVTGRGAVLAQASVVCAGGKAQVVELVHHGAFPLELAALVVRLVWVLRREHPEVTVLEINERRDRVLAQGLAAAGLRVVSRGMQYRLPLRSFR
ncbi:hypothetical protein JOF53_000873 [Crossiella equi]|uniref:N-acetyltransferase domain-containing protein n=1 Tax=Crossiella equi TaxID=130796 RepID=A0ABS5A619_9PSEU|nr:hypothetical protein [Crossiella equi]MBP2472001.1 hypothetical protein [Crossiella equi]